MSSIIAIHTAITNEVNFTFQEAIVGAARPKMSEVESSRVVTERLPLCCNPPIAEI